jgi:acetolactate synthase I/II/III large subunit
VVLTAEGKGAVPYSDPHVIPLTGGYSLLGETDAIVIVGSRFVGAVGATPLPDGTRVVRIDIDPEEMDRDITPDVALLGDAGPACTALAEALGTVRGGDDEEGRNRMARVAELRSAIAAGLAERFGELAGYCSALRQALGDDGILVDEMTQVGYFGRNGYPVNRPRTYIGSGYQGTLGFGYATSLGVKVGRPEVPVVSISGDGGFLYNVGELATAVHHGIGVVAVVFDDGAFGNVKRIQSQTFGREIASTLTNPDFVALGASFGMAAYRATDAAALQETLDAALGLGAPALIEVPIGPQPDVWPILTGRETF